MYINFCLLCKGHKSVGPSPSKCLDEFSKSSWVENFCDNLLLSQNPVKYNVWFLQLVSSNLTGYFAVNIVSWRDELHLSKMWFEKSLQINCQKSNPSIPSCNLSPRLLLFRKRLFYKRVKAYSTMPKGTCIIGNVSIPLFDWSSQCFTGIEGKVLNMCICSFSFLHY